MEDGKIRLGEDRKEELNTILSLIDKYRIETDTDAKNHLIKIGPWCPIFLLFLLLLHLKNFYLWNYKEL